MQINYQQFRPASSKALSPLYLFSGDVPLLEQEGREQLKQEAHNHGFTELQRFDTAVNFDWNSLAALAATQSLFSEKNIIDIRHHNAKFDLKTQKVILQYLENPCPDTLIVISCGKLTPAQKKAKWFKTLCEKATVIIIWPVSANDLSRWIKTRLQQVGLQASADSIRLLANYTEGNLLATHQAIEKLRLLEINHTVSIENMADVISNNARFNVFDCSNYALQGNAPKVLQTLEQLQASGAEATLVLWALCRDLRDLQKILHAEEQGKNSQAFLQSQWRSRQTSLQAAVKRCQLKEVNQLLRLAHHCDQVIKGMDSGNSYSLLSQIALGICGMNCIHLSMTK